MSRVVTFGEIMLRLEPEGYLRFVQAPAFHAIYGGGEANVAISLAQFGIDTAFVTKLPGHEIGQAAMNTLRQFGVNTGYVSRGGNRLGIYFIEKGASQRASKVIYDRMDSAFSRSEPEDFDWDVIFDGAEWFHFTGITPAIKGNLPDICEQACIAAKKRGLTISCDLNYRNKLWTRQEAQQTMTRLLQYADVCIGNEEDAKDVFGIEAKNSDINGGSLDQAGYRSVASQLAGRFGFKKVAITLRSSLSASDNNWAAMLYDGEECLFSKSYTVHIVDRVGSGDSFSAGLIYSLLNGADARDALDFATAASCLKHSIEGDYNIVGVDEVNALVKGDGSGRVQR